MKPLKRLTTFRLALAIALLPTLSSAQDWDTPTLPQAQPALTELTQGEGEEGRGRGRCMDPTEARAARAAGASLATLMLASQGRPNEATQTKAPCMTR